MSEKEERVAIIPLSKFDSDVDIIPLEHDLCLRRIVGNEIEELVKLAPGYETTLKAALLDLEFVVEKRFTKKVAFEKWMEKSRNVSNIILALRLLKPGELFAPTAFFIKTGKQKSSIVTNTRPLANALPELFLKRTEIADFVELWRKLKPVPEEKPYLIFALKQFSEIFYVLDDQLVNYMMAFESLVFRREMVARPHGKAIGISISMLIGKSEEERIKIQNDIVEAYDLRNKIVHGHLEMSKTHQKRVRNLFDRVEDYLRRSLRRFVEE